MLKTLPDIIIAIAVFAGLLLLGAYVSAVFPAAYIVPMMLVLLVTAPLLAGAWFSAAYVLLPQTGPRVVLLPLLACWLHLPGWFIAEVGAFRNALGVHKYVLLAVWAGTLLIAAALLLRALWRGATLSARRKAALAAAIALLAYLGAFPAIILHDVHGDEPYYLWMCASVLADGDLDLTNNVPPALHHLLEAVPQADGSIRHHAGYFPTYCALLLPGYALAGNTGAVFLQLLLATVLAWQFWKLCTAVFAEHGAACFSWLCGALCAPAATFATHIYPELFAALLTVIALRLLLREKVPVAAVALCLGTLPWLHARYAYLALALLLAALWRLRTRKIAAAALVTGVGVLGLAMLGYRRLLSAPGHRGGEATLFPELFPSQVLRFFLDQEYGLWFIAPIFLLLPLAVYVALRRVRALSFAGGVSLLVVAGFSFFHGWFGIWGVGAVSGRYLAPVAPFLALLTGFLWQQFAPRGRTLLTLLLGVSLLLYLAGAIAPVFRYERADGRNRLVQTVAPQAVGYLPSLVRVGTHFSLPLDGKAYAWLAAVLLLNVVAARALTQPSPAATRRPFPEGKEKHETAPASIPAGEEKHGTAAAHTPAGEGRHGTAAASLPEGEGKQNSGKMHE